MNDVLHSSPVSQSGFTMIPNVVMLDERLSCGAKLVYGYLKHLAWRSDSERVESAREAIQQDLGIGKNQVTAYIGELVAVGLVEVKRRGQGHPNLYTIHDPQSRESEEVRKPESGFQESPNQGVLSSQDLEVQEEPEIQGSQESLLTAKDARGVTSARKKLGRVDRKEVSLRDLELASEVLAHWNMRSGQTLTSEDWLKMIVMRIREHPDMTADDHRDLIHLTLSDPDPWWKSPSPSIIYGSGAQFERCITAALSTVRNGHHPRQEAKRFGRGLTPAQVIELTRNR